MYLLRKVIYSLFSSSYVMLALLLVFITAMASATFIERDYGIVVAWNQIYDTLWFESIMFALSGCFIANIIKYQLIHKKKWALLLFHLAFITILVGAAVTRYTSLSGVLRVREGEKSSTVISTKNYFQINYQPKACLKQKGCVKRKKTALSFHDEQHFSGELEYKKKSLFIHISQYISNAEIRLKKNPEHGKPSVEIIVNEGIKKTNLILQESQQKSIETEKQIIEFGTSNTMPKENVTIFIFEDNGQLWMQTKEDLEHFKLKMNRPISIKKNKMYPVQIKTLYQGQNYSFMFLNYFPKGEKVIITKDQKSSNTSQNTQDVLVVNLTWNGEKADAMLTYKEGFLPAFETIRLGKHVIDIGYGSLAIPMPFALYLDDFRLTRYPGSSSPSAYESDITIIDEEKSIPYMIYMNNVLDWKGYRFYQASYDSDEQGTVLSVNKDWWGTHITYLGYAMLVIGMFFTLFAKKSRFQGVRMKLKALAKQNYAILIFAFLSYTLLWHEVGKTKTVFRPTYIAQEKPPQASNGPLVYVDPILADKWGQILVQDINGRIKPMNTLALEIIRKLSGKRTLPIPTINAENQEKTLLNANQMMLSMHVFPNQWKKIDLIKWNKKKLDQETISTLFPTRNVPIKKLLSYNDFFDSKGDYLLKKNVEAIYEKDPSLRNAREKELMALDERVNIVLNLLKGKYTKVFPKKNDAKQTWYSYTHHFNDFSWEDGNFSKNILPQLFQEIILNMNSEAWDKMSYIQTYQRSLAKDIIPTKKQVRAEIWYNQLNISFWLFCFFITLGFSLLMLSLAKIFFDQRYLIWLQEIIVLLIFIGGLCFTASLALRWYIGGQAPWSNGYEMIVFVAWTLLVAGFFSRKSTDFALPLSTCFSGILLFVSYLDWLNPEITPLMPVLKSYWLKVHVTTIVSSYAPLTLSALLAIMALLLYVFRPSKKGAVVSVKIKELSYLNELSMIMGLFILTVGTFLGGVWANESWGRYWAWDPKETWALISIIVYAFTLHLRFIPFFNNIIVFNIVSMFSYWSIVMTSFGVNYYLSGLHSYATGDPVPVPSFVYIVLIFMFLLSFLAIRKRKGMSI